MSSKAARASPYKSPDTRGDHLSRCFALIRLFFLPLSRPVARKEKNMEVSGSGSSSEVWNFVWQTFANASMTYDLVSSQNVTKGNVEDNGLLDNPAKLGILTGFLIACLADFRIATPKFQLDVELDSKLKTMALSLVNVVGFLLLAPMISGALLVLYVYRKVVELTLKIQLGDEFAGLLTGTDCVWALEESTALSVINALAVLDKKASTSSEHFLRDFRKLIYDSLISSRFDKLNWLREKKYGYYYWRRSDEAVPVEERVRWLEVEDDEDGKKIAEILDCANGHFLRTSFASVTNRPLPREHSACWEILVGRTSSGSAQERSEGTKKDRSGLDCERTGRKTTIPVLFRVHHCLGDGVALLRLLLESIADSESIKMEDNSRGIYAEAEETATLTTSNTAIRVPLLKASSTIRGTLRDENEILYYANDLLSASMPFTTTIPLRSMVKSIVSYIDDKRKILKNLKIDDVKGEMKHRLGKYWTVFRVKYVGSVWKKVNTIVKTVAVLFSMPSCLVQQALRSMDNSALHGPTLTGSKLVSCWMESESTNLRDFTLLSKIRDIKNATGTRFGDVVLTALSASLHRYFYKIGEAAPKSMTVVIPARMTLPTQKLSLQNGFSVGLLSLCVSEVNGESVEYDCPEDSRLLERLGDVSRCSETLRKDPDFLINFWVMNWLSAALPESILRPVLESHSTLVFSNLPGPQEVTIIGNKLKNVAFWIPNRGKTGIGCSFLSYGGKVHVSLVADIALVRSQRLLDEILRDTVEDIAKLHETITMSCFAMNLRDRSDAPTERGLGVL